MFEKEVSMEFKKLVRILSIAAIAVWLFSLSFLISYQVVEKKTQNGTTTLPPIVTNTPIPNDNAATLPDQNPTVDANVTVTTQAPTQSEQPTQQGEQPTEAPTQAPTQAQPAPGSNIPSTKAEAIAAYVNGINTLKATPNFTCLRVSKLNVSIDKISGGTVVEKAANMVIEQNQIPPTTYNFVGGVDAASGATPMSVLPPPNKQCIINEDYVTSATCTPTADGGYTMTLLLKDEAHIYPNEAANLAGIVEVVDTTALIPAQATTHYIEIYYSGVYVTANFDSQGRIIYAKNYMEVQQMRGSGSMMGFTMTVEGHGDFYGEYTITY